jgi:hypothetical protein
MPDLGVDLADIEKEEIEEKTKCSKKTLWFVTILPKLNEFTLLTTTESVQPSEKTWIT